MLDCPITQSDQGPMFPVRSTRRAWKYQVTPAARPVSVGVERVGVVAQVLRSLLDRGGIGSDLRALGILGACRECPVQTDANTSGEAVRDATAGGVLFAVQLGLRAGTGSEAATSMARWIARTRTR